METYKIKLLKDNLSIDSYLKLSKYDCMCRLELSFVINDREIIEGSFTTNYFNALSEIRLKTEPLGLLIGCNGAREYFYPSRMAIQMSEGKVGYVLGLGKKADRKVQTFYEFFDVKQLSSVEEQKLFF